MKLGRVVFISAAGAAAVAGAATLLFFNGSTKEYRECVALMWDRKHPVQVRQRLIEMAAEKCEKDRLSNGFTNCDPERIITRCEKAAREWAASPTYRVAWEYCVNLPIDSLEAYAPPPEHPPPNPCDSLSLEDLRRADPDASRDKP
jgi:hypothetical protein